MKPHILTRNEYNELQYGIQTGVKFPQFLPFAYYRFQIIQIIDLFIFNTDGALFKKGFCKQEKIYDYHTNPGEERIKLFHELLEITLYEKMRDALTN